MYCSPRHNTLAAQPFHWLSLWRFMPLMLVVLRLDLESLHNNCNIVEYTPSAFRSPTSTLAEPLEMHTFDFGCPKTWSSINSCIRVQAITCSPQPHQYTGRAFGDTWLLSCVFKRLINIHWYCWCLHFHNVHNIVEYTLSAAPPVHWLSLWKCIHDCHPLCSKAWSIFFDVVGVFTFILFII